MESLRRVYQIALDDTDWPHTHAIFLRPDLWLESDLPISLLPLPNHILLPSHGSYGGYNDQMAIASRGDSADTYTNRGSKLASYFTHIGSNAFASERITAWALRAGNVTTRRTRIAYQLVRPRQVPLLLDDARCAQATGLTRAADLSLACGFADLEAQPPSMCATVDPRESMQWDNRSTAENADGGVHPPRNKSDHQLCHFYSAAARTQANWARYAVLLVTVCSLSYAVGYVGQHACPGS